VALLADRRRRSAAEWLFLAFPVLYLALLLSSPKVAENYLLPVSLGLCYPAGVGAYALGGWIVRLGTQGLRRAGGPVPGGKGVALAALALGLFLVLYHQVPRLRSRMAEFRTDDRRDLRDWIEKKLPAEAVILQDRTVNLPTPGWWRHQGVEEFLPQKIHARSFAADFGDYGTLRSKGVTHVAVSRMDYHRFLDAACGLPAGRSGRGGIREPEAVLPRAFREGRVALGKPRRGGLLHPSWHSALCARTPALIVDSPL
jgi:hypothetical protein